MFNKYFDNIYFINLDKRPDRLQNIKNQCDKFNITDIKRFPAIEGNTLQYNSNLLSGEAGCMESHLKLIEHAKKSNYKSILILEDDCYFNENSNLILDKFMNEVPKCDVIMFGANYITPPIVISDYVLRCTTAYALHCYAVYNTAYDKILDICNERKVQIDVYYKYMMEYGLLSVYCPNPPFASQITNYSDIQHRICDYSNVINRL